MKKIVIFFLVLAVLMSCGCVSLNRTGDSAADAEPLKLAVMEFQDMSGKLSKKMLSVATEQIRGKFVSTNKYVVIAKERQEKEMIKEMKKESYKLCNDKNCQIPLGQALSADTILRTTITFFAGSYTIISELIDLEKEATVKGAEATFDGSEKSLKEAINSIVAQIVGKRLQKEKPAQNSKDHETCEYARQDATVSTWKQYLDEFPRGECSREAAEAIDKLACSHAEKANSIEGWELYLKHQSKGNCSFKAKAEIKKMKKEKKQYLKGHKIGSLIWSDRSSNKMKWSSAKQYCEDLSEGGFTDWRLPNVDELRTLIKNRRTVTGRACKASERRGCLSTSCWSWETCAEACNHSWDKCTLYWDGRYSKFGDTDWFWSSSTLSDYPSSAWGVNFYIGAVSGDSKSLNGYVRCVR